MKKKIWSVSELYNCKAVVFFVLIKFLLQPFFVFVKNILLPFMPWSYTDRLSTIVKGLFCGMFHAKSDGFFFFFKENLS